MFTFACSTVEGLTLAQKRATIAALRESIKQDVVLKRAAKATAKAEKAATREAKRAERIAKLKAKLDALTNPVGTKAVKANRKAGAVKVWSADEVAEANAIAAKLAAKRKTA